MSILGIDPGLNGGLAWFDGKDLALFEIPTVKARARGNEVVWTALADTVKRIVEGPYGVRAAWVERVSAMPGQGVASMFKFGYVAGGLHGLLAANRVPVNFVMPAMWKRALSVPAAKEGAVARACELFPKDAGSFRGPRGGWKDGLAEAALIAYYGFHHGG